MKIFKNLQVSIDFSINSEPPTNAYFQNFLNFSVNFRETFDKILKNFKKSQNLLENFKKL